MFPVAELNYLKKLVRSLTLNTKNSLENEFRGSRSKLIHKFFHGRAAEIHHFGLAVQEKSLRRQHSSISKRAPRQMCSGSSHPSEATRWIKEVEMATSVDDPKTARSILDDHSRTSRPLMRGLPQR